MVSKDTNPELWAKMDDHLDLLLLEAEKLKKGDKVLLVGPNASGKSFFRKLLSRNKKLGDKVKHVHASMALRTGSFPEMGALSSMLHDNDDDATSYSTISNVTKAIESCASYIKDGTTCSLHIDEPEIGFGAELQLGTGTWLRGMLEGMSHQPVLTMVTTHSAYVGEAFLDWKLLDLGFKYKTVEEWVKRKVTPANPVDVVELNRIMFSVIQTRVNKAAAKKSL